MAVVWAVGHFRVYLQGKAVQAGNGSSTVVPDDVDTRRHTQECSVGNETARVRLRHDAWSVEDNATCGRTIQESSNPAAGGGSHAMAPDLPTPPQWVQHGGVPDI
ncbi:unnamed protein product [Closterium sp. NIES-54]